MKIKYLLLILFFAIIFSGCISKKQKSLSQYQNKKIFNLVITKPETPDLIEKHYIIKNDLFDVIGQKLEKKFRDRRVVVEDNFHRGIKIDVTLKELTHVNSLARFIMKEDSGDAILKVRVELINLENGELIHEAFLSKKSSPRKGKGDTTADHIDEIADEIVFMLRSSRI